MQKILKLKVTPEFADLETFICSVPKLFKDKRGALIKSGRNEIDFLIIMAENL